MKKTAAVILCFFFVFAAVVPSVYSAQESLEISNPDGIDEYISEIDGFADLTAADFADETVLEVAQTSSADLHGKSGDFAVEKSEEIIVVNDEIVSGNPELKHLSKANKKKESVKEDANAKTSVQKEEDKDMSAIAKKVQSAYKAFISSDIVSSVFGFIKTAWVKSKNFIKSLPGIRHYLNSKYSKENYKKELSGPAIEVPKTNLKKQDTEGMTMLQKEAVDEKVLEKTTSSGKKVKVQPL